MRDGYLEPEDRPLEPPYESTIDDWSDLHETLDQATRALANDAAFLNQTIYALKDQRWVEDWRWRKTEVRVRHDGEKIAIWTVPGEVTLKVDPFGLLINYRAVVPALFGDLVKAWVANFNAKYPPLPQLNISK